MFNWHTQTHTKKQKKKKNVQFIIYFWLLKQNKTKKINDYTYFILFKF